MKEDKQKYQNILGEIPKSLTLIGILLCILALVALYYAASILFKI